MKKILASILLAGVLGFLPSVAAGQAAKMPATETVLVTYQVKPGEETEFARVLGRHWPTLRRLGLVLETPHLTLRGVDEEHKTYFVEILTWRDHDAPDNVPPEVRQIWKRLESFCEQRLGHQGIEFPEVAVVSLPK